MSAELKSWPERIWLQHGDETEVPNYGDCHDHDVTWCWHQIDGTDVEYVRADCIADLERQNAELKQQLAAQSEDAGRLLAVLIEAREALQFANDSPGGGIHDTIWMMHRPETLFDFMDAAIDAMQSGKEPTK